MASISDKAAFEDRVRQSTCFSCKRLNPSTYLIVEDDRFEEHPFIYAKVYSEPPLLLLSDTGCGGKVDKKAGGFADNLRNFLETHLVAENDNRPLNPRNADGLPTLKYLIICTHCHFDHILGIPCFDDVSPTILASSYDKSFIDKDRADSSLCGYLDLPTPQYDVSYWAAHEEHVKINSVSIGVQILHTPGHTPDELAWYDKHERHLYVGDSFYERVADDKSYEQAIIFPKHGNIITFMQSLERMLSFVKEKNAEPGSAAVKIGCGHVTSAVDGHEILLSVQQYFRDVIDDKILVKRSRDVRGEIMDLWQSPGEPRFSLYAPRRLIAEARAQSIPTIPRNPKLSTSRTTSIGILLFDGFQALDAFGPLDCLNILATHYPLSLSLITSDPTLTADSTLTPVATRPSTSFSQSVLPTHTTLNAPPLDVLIVPGGVGTRDAAAMQLLADYISRIYDHPQLRAVISVCTGAALVARSGKVKGRRATTNKRAWKFVTESGKGVRWVKKARWVVDGKWWSGAGVSAGIDVTLAWIGSVWGEDEAQEVADGMEYRRAGGSGDDEFAGKCGLLKDGEEEEEEEEEAEEEG